MTEIRFLSSISEIDQLSWDQLVPGEYPFAKHGFLSALERTQATTKETGWQPHHLVVEDNGKMVAAMPMFEKTNSYGEYVFDWAWADAYHRNGVPYYPKLVAAIPFTPASGPRFLGDYQYLSTALNAIFKLVENRNLSSFHLLLPNPTLDQQLINEPTPGLMQRSSSQFHWFNQVSDNQKTEKFTDFQHFLNQLQSRKRKNINKERKRVADQGITLKRISGGDVTEHQLTSFYHFYQATYYKRDMHGYLSINSFKALIKNIGDQMIFVFAERRLESIENRFHNKSLEENNTDNVEYIGAALFFFDTDTLYGRYWGCLEEYDCLHFEACYYQGIEIAIDKQLSRFDPGTQGEHKIPRGFKPVLLHSYHWIAHPQFAEAIAQFLHQERHGINAYIQDCNALLPFKSDQ